MIVRYLAVTVIVFGCFVSASAAPGTMFAICFSWALQIYLFAAIISVLHLGIAAKNFAP